MKELTQEGLKKLLNYDPETGMFIWRERVNRRIHIGDMAGGKDNHGHMRIMIEGRYYKSHRLAWLYVHGKWPKYQIDHINGIPDDNRIDNLRDVTQLINMQNLRKASVDSKTGLLGVMLHKCGRYHSQIKIYGKLKHLGLFDTAEEAYQAYLEAKRKYHEGCTI